MESIYVIEPGSYVRREGSSLNVVKGGSIIDRVACDGLKRLMLIGYISLSGPVLDFLIRRRIETVFVTPTGRFRARLGLDEHKHVNSRKSQFNRLSDKAFALETAKLIVKGKIDNMYQFCLLRARQYKDNALGLSAARLKSMTSSVTRVEKLDVLRGLEGAASRAYFSTFSDLIRNPLFTFAGRNRRPPLDPINAMLSFAYTLLTNEVLSAISICGLDPYFGALHEVSYGRPSLACDLVEEYRFFLGDRLVLSLINRKMIGPDDFVYRKKPPAEFTDEQELKAKRPVEMKPAICRAFLSAYEEMMKRQISYSPLGKRVGYRNLILNQIRAFSRYLQNPEETYHPFVWQN